MSVTQSVGDARLDTRHPHMADAVLVLWFHQHSQLDVPQCLDSDLQEQDKLWSALLLLNK